MKIKVTYYIHQLIHQHFERVSIINEEHKTEELQRQWVQLKEWTMQPNSTLKVPSLLSVHRHPAVVQSQKPLIQAPPCSINFNIA